MENFAQDLVAVSQIDAIPNILEVICRTTGLGFSAVARVTEDRWIACAVRDEIAFGLEPGGELRVETTICNEIRQNGRLVAIDHVSEDPLFCRHPTPERYGFQSYISAPITLRNGRFFGTLCAISREPARLNAPETIGMFTLFADLIAFHLDARDELTRLEAMIEHRTVALHEANAELERRITATEADRQTLRALTERLERVREDERTDLARELHDEFGQALTALKIDPECDAEGIKTGCGSNTTIITRDDRPYGRRRRLSPGQHRTNRVGTSPGRPGHAWVCGGSGVARVSVPEANGTPYPLRFRSEAGTLAGVRYGGVQDLAGGTHEHRPTC